MDLPLSATKIRKLDPKQALENFIHNVNMTCEPEIDIVVKRESSMIVQLLKKYKNPKFNLRAPLNIQFVSLGVIEPGIDAGAPRREFFYLLTKELVRGTFNGMQLFEGEIGHLVPINNYELVSSHIFEMVGKMILHSLLNQCQGVEGISPAVASYIFSGNWYSVLEHLSLRDVPDPCLRQKLQEVSKWTLFIV